MTLDEAKRSFNKVENRKNQILLKVTDEGIRKSEVWYDLYYGCPNSSEGSIKALKKRVDAFIRAHQDHPIVPELMTYMQDMQTTATAVQKAKTAHEAAKAEKKSKQVAKKEKAAAAISTAEFKTLNTPLAGHRTAFVARIVAAYQRQLQTMIDTLAAANWDLNKVAPYPTSNMGRYNYKVAEGRYHFYRRYFSPVNPTPLR